ncbi:MAG TPA: hypothetical protein VK517_00115 [Cyclobacteriaceae bacterium]|nr:hypothetical protein [Cyclobacteriaceae bacterium]
MITKTGILFFLVTSICSFGQIRFENGYFISNDGVKTVCLIKDSDWSSNPTAFKYKFQAADRKSVTTTIKEVKEFGVSNSKYIRAKVKIDKSPEEVNKLSNTREPEWVEQEVFLEAVVEGRASLYAYREHSLERYFYSVDGSPIEQLIYKQYRAQGVEIGVNQGFIGQLWAVHCDAMSSTAARRISYHSKRAWTDYFNEYDKCMGTASIYYNSKYKFDINLRVTPGIDNAFINTVTNAGTVLFETKRNLRVGMEAEFVLPVNKGKWSFIIEPTYRYYHVGGTKLDVQADLNGAAGIGYSYKKLGIEFRYYTRRNVTVNYHNVVTDYAKTSLILGYKLF